MFLQSSNEHLKEEIQKIKINLDTASKQKKTNNSEYILLQDSNDDLKKEIKLPKKNLVGGN